MIGIFKNPDRKAEPWVLVQTAAKFVMSPPIRSEEHRLVVRAGLAGGALQLVATDHCGWTNAQKDKGRNSFLELPKGVNGIEERMHVTWHQLVNSGAL